MLKINVVIPNWNGKEWIAECLDSLESQTLKPSVTVVDNGSTDRSKELIKGRYPSVKLIELDKNYGFDVPVNIGIRAALKEGCEYVTLFNNDAVADTNWVEMLANAAEAHMDAGIVTGKLMNIDKKHFDSTAEIFYSWGVPGSRGRGHEDTGQYEQSEYVFGATAGASLYRSDLFKDIGLFDEDFFAYAEDNDISFRAQLAGWKVYYESSAVAYHHINATSSRVHGFHAYHTMKNLPMLFWKNVPLRLLPVFIIKFSIMYIVTFIAMARQGVGFAAFKGIFAGLYYLPKKLIERRKVQKNRKVSVEYIKSIITYDLPPGTTKLRKILRYQGKS
jgi:GT2 family glycosyltransferase